jgi:hypothetical protein
VPDATPRHREPPKVDYNPKQVLWAGLMGLLGAFGLGLSLWLPSLSPSHPGNWLLDDSLNIFLSSVIVGSYCLLGVSFAGTFAHKWTDLSLKFIDLIWISCAAVGLALAIAQMFISTNDKITSELNLQLDSYRLEIIKLSDAVTGKLCAPTPAPSDTKICDAVDAASVMALSVERVPLPIQAEVICNARVRSDERAEKVLAELCGVIQKTQTMKSSLHDISAANDTVRYVLTPVWQSLLSLALGVRLSKSVIEVGWLRIGPPPKSLPAPVRKPSRT